jgi:uncharacterized protein YecE (DUF72 family)
MGELRVGVSGWAYREWKEVFYPKGLARREELAYASAHVNSLEINGTFYSLQTPKTFEKWFDDTPDDFVFALKGSKFITHQKKLLDSEIPLANYFASGVLLLGKKLGPILWQFAPWYRFDRDRILEFLSLLPRETKAAVALAKKNTIKNDARKSTTHVNNAQLRYAFEPRHESFFTGEFAELLRDHHAAMAISDTGGKFPYSESLTSDLVYVRLHGDELYKSDYRDSELKEWSKRIKKWRGNKAVSDIYVYFDNTIEGHAIQNAIHLTKQLGIKQ